MFFPSADGRRNSSRNDLPKKHMRILSFIIGCFATAFMLAALCVEQIILAFSHAAGLCEKPPRKKELHRIGYGGEYITERGEIVRR
jgi:hypothetical protein